MVQAATDVLAVATPQRLALLPDVPTMAEAGVVGYEFTGWHGIAVRAGTPDKSRPDLLPHALEARLLARSAGDSYSKAWHP